MQWSAFIMGLQQTFGSIGGLFSGSKQHSYSAIRDPEDHRNERLTATQRARGRRYLMLGMVAVAVSLLLLLLPSWPYVVTLPHFPETLWTNDATRKNARYR